MPSLAELGEIAKAQAWETVEKGQPSAVRAMIAAGKLPADPAYAARAQAYSTGRRAAAAPAGAERDILIHSGKQQKRRSQVLESRRTAPTPEPTKAKRKWYRTPAAYAGGGAALGAGAGAGGYSLANRD